MKVMARDHVATGRGGAVIKVSIKIICLFKRRAISLSS
jgi:translation elongation factor P/translation initiation factor 5A